MPLPSMADTYSAVTMGANLFPKSWIKWAYERGIELDFSRPGKPTDNAKVESFNGPLRQECLNAHWFLSLEGARRKIDEWRQYYNETRPHSALQWATPAEFARQQGKTPCPPGLLSRNFLF
jgi:putative transposase